jgi:quinol monooxygenase YgiN
MAYVVIARWTARDGEQERVRAAIAKLVAPSRAEPGCRVYQPARDPEDRRRFVVLEVYDDEAAFRAHGESEHFRRHGLNEGIPLLEHRERELYETLD